MKPAPQNSMKALVCMRAGVDYHTNLELHRSYPLPSPCPSNSVVVRCLYAGLAFPDVLTSMNKHVRPLKKTPVVLGRECSGIVVGVGCSVRGLAVGDNVFGMAENGAWAEYVVLREEVS